MSMVPVCKGYDWWCRAARDSDINKTNSVKANAKASHSKAMVKASHFKDKIKVV